MSNKPPAIKFKKTFFWGASISAHQAEGGNHNQWSVWELENAKVKAAQAEYHISDLRKWPDIKKFARDPDNYVSGEASSHYGQYRKDFDLLEKMHMNAFRFSIEWSRVEPECGAFDSSAFKYYKEYLKELRARRIEPVVTLFHFSLPVWFVEMGGFEKRSNVKYFLRFVSKIADELGSNFKYVITINEPEIYAYNSYYAQEWPPMKSNLIRMLLVIKNLIRAHNGAYKLLKAHNRRLRVSFAKNSGFFYAGDDALLSRITSSVLGFFQDTLMLNLMKRRCDFMAINYYQSNRIFGNRTHNPENGRYSDLDWFMQPSDIEFVLKNNYDRYQKPILITENGLADADDANRKWWIGETIMAMGRAIESGVDLMGYIHWSLIDNFEWAYGKWPRFGLAEVDYKTKDRKLRTSAEWFGRIIKKIREN